MTRIFVFALALSFAAAALVATAEPAAACSCAAGPDSSVGPRLANADAAFVGTYLGRNDPLATEPGATGARTVINQFQVESAVKGDLGETVEVFSAADDASCGVAPGNGERVGLLLTRGAGGFRSDLCSRVEPDALISAGAGGVQGFEVLAAVVAGLALVAVATATALGPGRAGSFR
ncbi:MAG: hypothetical protein KY454_07020 [Actinobacteria bacterium]|nr:hypothetical protein [Actinomycetota bacterium]MBW3649631.1 hypothetical protein [Actinomycetota bacterium]